MEAKEVSFRKRQVDPEKIQSVLKNVVKLDLRNCGLSNEVLMILASGLDKLRALNISANPGINEDSMMALSQALAKNTSLERLNLSDTGLCAQGLSMLSSVGLGRNLNLKDLNLGQNPLCDISSRGHGDFCSSGIEALTQAIQSHPSLTRLDLSGTQLLGLTGNWAPGRKGSYNPTALKFLVRCKHSSTLAKLILSENAIFETEASPIIQNDFCSGSLRFTTSEKETIHPHSTRKKNHGLLLKKEIKPSICILIRYTK